MNKHTNASENVIETLAEDARAMIAAIVELTLLLTQTKASSYGWNFAEVTG